MTMLPGTATVGVAGHRPDRLGGFQREERERLEDFALVELERLEPGRVVSGMALGWDQAAATAARLLGVPFDAVCPFPGFDARWQPSARRRLEELLEAAASVTWVSPPPFVPWKMHARNRVVIDRSDFILALYDGRGDSGTAAALELADKIGVRVDNAWPRWRRVVDALVPR